VNDNAEKWRMSAYYNRLYEAMYLKVLYVFTRISRPQWTDSFNIVRWHLYEMSFYIIYYLIV